MNKQLTATFKAGVLESGMPDFSTVAFSAFCEHDNHYPLYYGAAWRLNMKSTATRSQSVYADSMSMRRIESSRTQGHP